MFDFFESQANTRSQSKAADYSEKENEEGR